MAERGNIVIRAFVCAITLLLLYAPILEAQHRFATWYFGGAAGIDFTVDPPVALADGRLSSNEAACAISDLSGSLLFYTDGVTAWDASHAVMPGADPSLQTGLDGCQSGTQGVIIIPKPGSATEYYIVTVDCMERTINGVERGMRYTLVDMRLRAGQGDVVIRNAPVYAGPTTEKLCAVRHTNGRDMWLIIHELGNDRFRAHLVTDAGISTEPVISRAGNIHLADDARGWLNGSPDGTKLVAVVQRGTSRGDSLIQLFDFDAATGSIVHTASMPVDRWTYGAAFSPDNTKLYVGEFRRLYQYDVSLATPQAIADSKTEIFEVPTPPDGQTGLFTSLQLGSDGKIYVAKLGESFLGVVNNPNASGKDCDYEHNGFSLSGRFVGWGLMNRYFEERPLHVDFDIGKDELCAGDCATVTDRSDGGITAWQWEFPGGEPSMSNERTPPPICYSDPGIFEIALTAQRGAQSITVRKSIVILAAPSVDAGADICICNGASVQLQASPLDGTYRWSPAESLSAADIANPIAFPLEQTVYTLEFTDPRGCTSTDSIVVCMQEPRPAELELATIRADPGDGISMPLVLRSVDGAPLQGTISFRARIHYQREALEVTHITPGSILERRSAGDEEILEIDVRDITLDRDVNILTVLHGDAFHFGRNEAEIRLTNFQRIGGSGICLQIGDANGALNVTGQCIGYRISLAPPPVFALINRSDAHADPPALEVMSELESEHTISIFNAMGVRVADQRWRPVLGTAVYRVDFERATFAAGVYFAVLRSHDAVATLQFIVNK